MLNLLRFAEGGRESYDQYAEALSETFLPRYGGEVLYAGDGGTPVVAEQGPGLGRRPARPLPLPRGLQPHGRRPRSPAGHAPAHLGAHRGRAPADDPW